MRLSVYRWFLLALCACAPPLEAQIIDYQIPHSVTTADIDGVISPGEWDAALKVQLDNETDPAQNIPALVATEVLLMEDGENLLAAFIASDPEPAKIRAFYSDRDRIDQGDFVGLVLDTFNDERRAFEFFVNPLGIQMDLIMDDLGGDEDDSWNAIWDSAGNITSEGFIVEMKIPLKQIRLASGLPLQTWGVDLLRYYPRDVRHRLSNNTKNYAVSCYLCQLKKAQGFPNFQQRTNLQLIPTLTAQAGEIRPDPATDPWTREDAKFEAGVDLRWGINEDLILNATLNPDFSQVEADEAQIDVNNTFTLFFEERREFFLDGSEYFNSFENLVHTRNIQDPDYGLKLTGKSGAHAYAVLAANDRRTDFVIPGNQGSRVASLSGANSQDLALRYRYDYGRRLTLGTLFTRRDADDYANNLLSTDLSWRLGDSDSIEAQVMYSDTDNPLSVQNQHQLAAQQNDAAWHLEYDHEGEHFELELSSVRFGKDYRADLGFITRTNYTEHGINPGYTWRPGAGHFFNEINVSASATRMEDLTGLKLEDNQGIDFSVEGPLQLDAGLSFNKGESYYAGRYYDDDNLSLFASVQPWGGAEFSFEVSKGKDIDFANQRPGDELSLSSEISLRLGRHLQIDLEHEYQRLEVTGGRLFASHLSDLRLTYQFSARSFIRAIVIHSTTKRDTSLYNNPVDAQEKSLDTQLLYSYRLNAQTRFFIGYSDSAIQEGMLDDLAATGRSVFAKFAYAWQY
ncbi:MAG: carbohydrate binding family 9 domain-containing protein [Pseudomonadales bacterium]|jgi:hypothetical protein|nr:carbohydrate binding family 9 domain-containing protein [Pseudomonadales bacterium]